MPVYEYVCQQCTSRFEKLQKGGGDVEPCSCPACGSEQVQKALSTFASGGQSQDKCNSGG